MLIHRCTVWLQWLYGGKLRMNTLVGFALWSSGMRTFSSRVKEQLYKDAFASILSLSLRSNDPDIPVDVVLGENLE